MFRISRVEPLSDIKLSPYIAIDGNRVHNVKLNSAPPTYKTVSFYVGRKYANDKYIADADLRNIIYKTGCL